MYTFIDEAKEESIRKKNSHDREDTIIEREVSFLKDRIKLAIFKGQNEFCYIDSNEWIYDGWMAVDTYDSTDRDSKGKNYLTELAKYKTNNRVCGYAISGPSLESIDWEYIRSKLTVKLKELGCKEVSLLFGPVDVTETTIIQYGPFRKKRYNTKTCYKHAIRVTW